MKMKASANKHILATAGCHHKERNVNHTFPHSSGLEQISDIANPFIGSCEHACTGHSFIVPIRMLFVVVFAWCSTLI